MLSIDFCLPDHLLTCTRVLGFRPCLVLALLTGQGCDRREGHFHDVRFPALAGRAATRAVLSRFYRFSRPFTTSPRTSRHPRCRFFLAAQPGSRSFPARLVKGSPCRDPRCLPSGDVGAPHLPAEGALPVFRKSRLTTDVDPMGFATLVRRDAALHSNEHHTESCDDDEESPSS